MDPNTYLDKDTITLSSSDCNNTVVGGGYVSPGYGAVPNVSISSPNVYSLGSNTSPYTITGGAGVNNPWATYTATPKIKLDGEGADIEVNGESLIGMIRKIEERLNILTPNKKLEAEWEELRALGNKYRKLEKHIQEKQATWDRLKAMPPPAID